jgi:hypothetical protein
MKTVDEAPLWLEYVRAVFEVLALGGLIATLAVGISSLNASRDSVVAAKDAVETSTRQLEEARYESVYEHQLDLWKLLAEHKELAPYILGGKFVPECKKPTKQPRNDEERQKALEAEKDTMAREAALATALDFYAYVFEQQAPRDENGSLPDHLIIIQDKPGKLSNITDDEWKGWRSWAGTIIQGFEDAPSMCSKLGDKGGQDYVYNEAFRRAVQDVMPKCGVE